MQQNQIRPRYNKSIRMQKKERETVLKEKTAESARKIKLRNAYASLRQLMGNFLTNIPANAASDFTPAAWEEKAKELYNLWNTNGRRGFATMFKALKTISENQNTIPEDKILIQKITNREPLSKIYLT